MKELFIDYIIILYQDIPIDVYKGLVSVFCLGTVLTMVPFELKRGLRYWSRLMFVEYVFLLFCSTVVFRSYNASQGHNFQPFWSYTAIQEGREELLLENIMNVVVFIPIGILLGIAFKQLKWWKALLIGAGISVSIEVLQFVLARGFSEVDDVMHNTLGCIMGFGIMLIARMIIKTKYRYV